MLPGIGGQDRCAVETTESRGEDASADWSRQWGGGKAEKAGYRREREEQNWE